MKATVLFLVGFVAICCSNAHGQDCANGQCRLSKVALAAATPVAKTAKFLQQHQPVRSVAKKVHHVKPVRQVVYRLHGRSRLMRCR